MGAADELLRSTLEAALGVAKAGERASPPVPAPQALRGVLHFKRYPAAARDFAKRAIDEDEEFRERVADEVTEAQVGGAGWLYLTRPDGWEQAFATLRADAGRRDDARREEQGVQELERRLLVADDRLRQEQMRSHAATEDADQARAELSEERRARREVQERLDAVEGAVAEAVHARDEALVARDAALADAEEAQAEAAAARTAQRAAEAALTSASVSEPSDSGVSDELAKRTEAAAAEARRLAEELQFLSDEFVGGARKIASSKARGPGPAPAPSAQGPPPRHKAAAPRRRPVDLPPGVSDGSREAAAALLRMPDVRVLVDGYNVSKRAWAAASIAEQRDRLVRALDDLALRTGAHPTVVFDGGDVDPMRHRSSTRSVQVLFSPDGVSADAIVIDCIGRCPPGTPVVVVSSDNEVRNGAKAKGARVVHSDTFLDVVRR
jgi:predicted RNA-binding protein with PIN domain